MPAPIDSDYVDDALELLVNQFADPLSFVRELVQNAIDAGSAEIDVSCELQPEAAGERGTLIIRVDDYGDGMDRNIIDTRLTRLFSSDKEEDLTKIGKFGIGFVSVFAVQPDAVCLDTGRLGESWRVLFRKDRTFTRIRLREPVEGTKIQVIKKVTRAEYEELEPRLKKALRFHCKHVEVALRYGGEVVSEPMDLDALLKVTGSAGTTSAVVGITRPEQPALAGYYNRGLTLLEEKSPIPRVSFKVNSPHLEHTLSRDNVLRDENYQATMALVETLLRGPLLLSLLQALDAALRAADKTAAGPYLTALAALLRQGVTLPAEGQELAVASGLQGELYPLAQLEQAAEQALLVHAAAASPLCSELVAKNGVAVVPWQAPLVDAVYSVLAQRRESGSRKKAALEAESEPPAEPSPEELDAYRIERRFVFPLPYAPAADADKQRGEALCAAVLAILRRSGSRGCAAVALGHLAYPGSGAGDRLSITQPEALTLSPFPAETAKTITGGLVINADRPTVRELLPLCDREPELAAYTLLKHGYLGTMTAEFDTMLLGAALETRWRRRKT